MRIFHEMKLKDVVSILNDRFLFNLPIVIPYSQHLYLKICLTVHGWK